IDAGAIGINIEDADPVTGVLKDAAKQAALVSAIRALADQRALNLFINARTDVFWHKVGEPEERLAHAVQRANTYRAAGASGLFVPGVTDPEVLRELALAIDGPLNVLASPGCPEVARLRELGVARVSVG